MGCRLGDREIRRRALGVVIMRKGLAKLNLLTRRFICRVFGHVNKRGMWFKEVDGFLQWGAQITCLRCGKRTPL